VEKEVRMAIQWKRDIDEALRESGSSNKPVLADFTAAPA
jgi:hypothetical protein